MASLWDAKLHRSTVSFEEDQVNHLMMVIQSSLMANQKHPLWKRLGLLHASSRLHHVIGADFPFEESLHLMSLVPW